MTKFCVGKKPFRCFFCKKVQFKNIAHNYGNNSHCKIIFTWNYWPLKILKALPIYFLVNNKKVFHFQCMIGFFLSKWIKVWLAKCRRPFVSKWSNFCSQYIKQIFFCNKILCHCSINHFSHLSYQKGNIINTVCKIIGLRKSSE